MIYKSTPSALPARYPALRRQQGVTLVELMIALAIGLLVTVAMLKVYVDASGMYRFNEGLARVQENGRFALEFIRRDARVAGFWGCNSNAKPNPGIKEASDAYIDVDRYITGTEGGDNDPDSITFRSATGSGSPLTTGMSGTAAGVTVKSVGALSTDTAVLISDCENGDLFQVTGISGETLAHAAAADANTSPNLSKAYAAGARVYEAHETTFSIQNDPSSGVPTLYREVIGKSAQPLVEGIENLQVLYGEDTDADAEGANGDGTANRYVAFDALDSGIGTARIVSVRISLLVRSIKDNLTTEPAPYTFNGSTVTPVATDKYLRKVFTTTVTLRNKAG